MKALVYTTYADCENKVKSLEVAGHEVTTFQYDKLRHEDHWCMLVELRHQAPDFAVFIGALDGPNHNVPSVDVLQKIRSYVPFIHMCNDAGDKPWWETLELWDKHNCFHVQVAIDGSSSPISTFKNGLSLLTPIDPRPFNPKPWEERRVRMGMSGNAVGHGARGRAVQGLIDRGILSFTIGTAQTRSYKDYADFLCDCKVVFNHPMTGSGNYQHVKGRVIEAGFAGACLFERRGSPTSLWFTPGVDYIEYDDSSVDSIVSTFMMTRDWQAGNAASQLHHKVVERHGPKEFWTKVLEKAGVK